MKDEGRRKDPRYSNLVWRPARPGHAIAVFLGPEAAESLKKRRRSERPSAKSSQTDRAEEEGE
jgi:hypothetical protein